MDSLNSSSFPASVFTVQVIFMLTWSGNAPAKSRLGSMISWVKQTAGRDVISACESDVERAFACFHCSERVGCGECCGVLFC